MSSFRASQAVRLGGLLRALLCLVLVALAVGGCSGRAARPGPTIVLAADGRAEQQILAQLTAQFLRDRGYSIRIETGLHAEWMTRRALEAGNVGLVWQETGSAWHTYLNHDLPVSNEAELYRRVREEDYPKGIVWLAPCEWSARIGLVIADQAAADYSLASIADLAQHVRRFEPDMVLCVPEELYTSPWGIRGMENVYGFRFQTASVHLTSPDEAYQGLLEGQCGAALGYTKDVALYGGELVTLRDSLGFFSASSLAPTIHASVANAYPELERVLAELTGELDAGSLAAMERELTAGNERAERLARQFLQSTELIGRR